jgi:electron transport complex protein RnfD
MLAAIAVSALSMHSVDPARYLDVATHLVSGGALLGAFFIATDYVTSPNTWVGQLVFGAGCRLPDLRHSHLGRLSGRRRLRVLLMNALTPVIDRYIRPRIYGRDRRGSALEIDA